MNSIFWRVLWVWKLFNMFVRMRGCDSTNDPTDITHHVSKSDLFRLGKSMREEHLVVDVSFFFSSSFFTIVHLSSSSSAVDRNVQMGNSIANCSVLFRIRCLVHYISILRVRILQRSSSLDSHVLGVACY